MAVTNFVFLHGGGQGGWVWAETVAALTAQAAEGTIAVLALDAPGCGAKRDRDTSALTFEDTARDLIADIEAAGMSEVVMVGHSQAGKVIPTMALLRPDLFRRLIFVTCSAPTPGLTTMEMMGDCLHGENDNQVGWPVDPNKATMPERLRAMFCNDMTDAHADVFMARLGKDMWPASNYAHSDWPYDHLAGFSSTFVHCLRDQSLPPVWQDRFAQRFHADRVVKIDAGHQVMNTRPQALAEVLLAEAEA